VNPDNIWTYLWSELCTTIQFSIEIRSNELEGKGSGQILIVYEG
jgi:hypothetical protein